MIEKIIKILSFLIWFLMALTLMILMVYFLNLDGCAIDTFEPKIIENQPLYEIEWKNRKYKDLEHSWRFISEDTLKNYFLFFIDK